MKRLKVGFLIDPMPQINPRYDTSFALIQECIRRRHTVWCCELKDLRVHHNTVEARLTKCVPRPGRGLFPSGLARWVRLNELDIFFIRKDPPFNMRYLSALYLLNRADKKPLMVNDPKGILLTNEKLSVLPFAPFCPPSLTGSSPEAFEDFLKRPSRLGWVFKPLYHKGGRGITWLRAADRPRATALIRRLTRAGKEPIICQKFIDHAATGDKRILILDGKILGAMRRIARKGEFRANLSKGAVAAKADVTMREKSLVRRLAPFLKRQGLYFVGIDVLSGYLSEINVTSPSGAAEINFFNKTRVESKIIDFAEKRVKRKVGP